MSNLLQRILTGIIAGTAAIAAIVYSPYGLMLFCALVALLGLYEFVRLEISERQYYVSLLVLAGLIWGAYLLIHLTGHTEEKELMMWQALPLILPLISIVVLFNPKETNPLKTIGVMATGLLYCFLPFLLLFDLSFTEGMAYDYRIPLGILILTWGLDVGAYFIGKAIGKRPLYPRISPKKTWEGSVGGALVCILLAVFFDYYEFANEGLTFSWIVVGIIISVFSQIGDLVESMYKRSVSLKDSGSILPGHGGILDRFDGTYISIPFIYFYFSLVS